MAEISAPESNPSIPTSQAPTLPAAVRNSLTRTQSLPAEAFPQSHVVDQEEAANPDQDTNEEDKDDSPSGRRKPFQRKFVNEDEFRASLRIRNSKKVERLKSYIHEEPKHAGDGLAKGMLSFGEGMIKGISGVVMEPIKGTKKEGALGFFKGVGKGIVGVPLNVAKGVGGLVSNTVEGIINTPKVVAKNKDKSGQKLFGIPHEQSMALCEAAGVPHPTTVLMSALRFGALEQEGIFRLSGELSVIQLVRQQYDNVLSGEEVDLSLLGPHEMSGLLKLYLRELPDPLMTFKGYPLFVDAQSTYAKDEEALAKAIKEIIESTLPAANKTLLQQLLCLLKLTAQKSNKNRMTPQNLAVVFGPSILRPENSDTLSELQDMGRVNGLVVAMINRYSYLFEEQ